eukprot:1138942-Pelagomonas_calceolata.AAC.6
MLGMRAPSVAPASRLFCFRPTRGGGAGGSYFFFFCVEGTAHDVRGPTAFPPDPSAGWGLQEAPLGPPGQTGSVLFSLPVVKT